jgi:hypothetical protein
MYKFTLYLLLAIFSVMGHAQSIENSNAKSEDFLLSENSSYFTAPFLSYGINGIQSYAGIARSLKIPVNRMLLTGYPALMGREDGVAKNRNINLNELRSKMHSRSRLKAKLNKIYNDNRLIEGVCADEKNPFLYANCVAYGIVYYNNKLESNDLPSKSEYEKTEDYNLKIKSLKDAFYKDNLLQVDFDIYRIIFEERGGFYGSDILSLTEAVSVGKNSYDADNGALSFSLRFTEIKNTFSESVEKDKLFKSILEKKYTSVFYLNNNSELHLKFLIQNDEVSVYKFPIDIVVAKGIGIDNFKNLKNKYFQDIDANAIAASKAKIADDEKIRNEKNSPEYILKMAYTNYTIIKNYCQRQVTNDILLVANSHIKKIESKLIPKLSKNQSKEKLQLYASSTAQTTVELGSAMGGQQFYCPVSFKNLEDYSKNLK